MKPVKTLLLVLLASLALCGCTAAVIGGVAATAAGVELAHDRRSLSTIINDQNLEMSVEDAIKSDRALASHNRIKVNVYNRVILLVGEVVNEQAKERAGELASGFIGARRLVNMLEVMPGQGFWARGGDTALAARINTGLLDITDIPGFDPDRVDITVAHGKVYLQGLVTHRAAQAVIDNARNTRNVKAVINLFEYIGEDDSGS